MTGIASLLLGSRRRVLVATLGALSVLDLGRSIYAHVGYARPVELWQPDPKRYADIAWPPGADLPPDTPRGAVIYGRHCAVCHGPDGRGNGPAAPSLIPRPRDFTSGQFKYKSTPTAEPPSDADLIHVVRRGLDASAMPYFQDLLPDADLREVVQYIKHFSPAFDGGAPHTLVVPRRIPASADSSARGRMLFNSRGCQACHGEDGRGGATLKDAKGYPVVARDLTAPWTFRGGSEPEQIWLRLTTGVGVMPSFAGNTTDNERWDLANYVLSIARTAPWDAGGKLAGPGQQPDLARRGAYLVHAEMCGLCHTVIDRTGIYRGDDYYLAGGMKVEAYPHGVLVSRNLTSDAETGRRPRWLQGELEADGHALDAQHHVGSGHRAWQVVRSRNRPRNSQRSEPGRLPVALAGDDLGSRLQLGRRGHPGADRLLARDATGQQQGSSRPRSRCG